MLSPKDQLLQFIRTIYQMPLDKAVTIVDRFHEKDISKNDLLLKEQKRCMEYRNLITVAPEIFQYASLKHIASYLGITDTSLSRIRKEFAKEH